MVPQQSGVGAISMLSSDVMNVSYRLTLFITDAFCVVWFACSGAVFAANPALSPVLARISKDQPSLLLIKY